MAPLAPRFDVTAPAVPLADLGHVHLIAIGGAGMSAVARLLLARGVTVSGSDAADSPTLEVLRSLGARVHVGHDADHLTGVDTVVVSSAIRDDNLELAAARTMGLRVLHRSQALASLMAGSRRVAVAGANGKTTTTSMLVVALEAAGADPCFASGGEIAQLGTNAAIGSGDAFVVEADESDGSFLAYRPDVAVVTNVQPDHLDYYGTAERVEQAYTEFVSTVPADGLVVACWDDPGSRRLARAVRDRGRDVVTYGYRAGADLQVLSTEPDGLGTRSPFVVAGVERILDLAVPGEHNVMDACAAYLAAVEGLGAAADAVLVGLAGFAGARRRFEVRGEVGGVTVVDDYAHNAPKVGARHLPAAPLHPHPGLRGRVRRRAGTCGPGRPPGRLRGPGGAGRRHQLVVDRRPAGGAAGGADGARRDCSRRCRRRRRRSGRPRGPRARRGSRGRHGARTPGARGAARPQRR